MFRAISRVTAKNREKSYCVPL